MKIRVPHLVSRNGRHGAPRYYWQPSATLKKAGWESQALGRDLDTAMKLANEWNLRVARWREGTPPDETARAAKRRLAKFAAAGTVRELIRKFRDQHFSQIQPSTAAAYTAALNKIDAWAGDQPPHYITRESCRVLLEKLARPATPDGPERLHRAAGTGRVLRTLLNWAVDEGHIASNPMQRVKIREGRARHAIWQDHAIAAMVAMADAMGLHTIGTATLLAADSGQRPGDLLKLSRTHLRTGTDASGKPATWLRLRQGKTSVWVDVRMTQRLAHRIAQQDTSRPGGGTLKSTLILTRESDGKPYPARDFIRKFAQVRAATIAGSNEHGLDPCPELAGLQLRDLRRTLIVRLAEAEVDLPGIAAISGHKIEVCKKILEVYLPRTTKMADAAIARLEAHRRREHQTTPRTTRTGA